MFALIIDRTHWTFEEVGNLTNEQLESLIDFWSGKYEKKKKSNNIFGDADIFNEINGIKKVKKI